MQRNTLASLIAVVALVSGLGGYLLGHRGERLDAPPAAPTAAAPAKPAATPPATPVKTATPPATPTPAATTTPAAPAQPASAAPIPIPATAGTPAPPTGAPAPFRFVRQTVGGEAAPEACLHFSRLLDESGRVKYGDYLEITPPTKAAIAVKQERICLGGLDHGEDYKVLVRAGLPSQDGGKLDASETVVVALGERAPVVAFQGKGHILPRQTSVGVPLTTVNVSKVNVHVYRIGERMVSQVGRSASIYYSDDDEAFGDQRRELQAYAMDAFRKKTGALVWSGTMEVRNVQNRAVTTAIPVREVVKDWKPGAYVVVAWNAADGAMDVLLDRENENYDYEAYYERKFATQWVIDSDIGLTTFTGGEGMTVFARSLQTAEALPGVEVSLIARNNEDIAKATTDAQGRAVFPAGLLGGGGAATPIMVMALDAKKADFNHIDIKRAAFDLSDRGIDGRAVPGPIDAFLYADRGIFRPGETVNVTALLRDRGANAIDGMPLTLVAKRPDGVEYRRVTMPALSAGGAHWPLELTRSARRGKWTVEAFVDPKGAAVGQIEIAVEDFVPQKLKVEIGKLPATLGRRADIDVPVTSEFLYGAPAADLDGEAELTIKPDPTPFPALPGFMFGDPEVKLEVDPVALDIARLDGQGRSKVTGALPEAVDALVPLRGELRVSVFEPGGRMTSTDAVLPIRTRPVYLGIRAAVGGRDLPPWYGAKGYTGAFVPEGHEATFEVVAVDNEGKRIARRELEWRIERVHRRFTWFRDNDGRWRWQEQDDSAVIAQGKLDAAADRPADIRQSFQWGPHKLVVLDRETDTRTVVKFYVGWGSSSAERDTPDSIGVSADKKLYAAGETAKLRIDAPFAGEALVVLASDRVLDTRTVRVPAGATTIDIPVSADWGAGAYALVTAYRPLGATAPDRAPVRAVGLAWLGVDPAPRSLQIAIGTPEKTLPRRKIVAPVKVANANGAEVFVTLAAVDEGILQLTKFRTPAPVDFYFGKRRLGVAMRDDYGRLLQDRAEFLGQLRSGGDGAGGAGLDVVPIKIASLFSGIVKLDAKGEASIELDVPDFSGQLRLMAVAFDKTRVGSAERRMYVRDAVATDLVLPRFLAPGDDSRATVSLHNVDGAAGEYRARVTTSGAVALAEPVDRRISLPVNKREQFAVAVRGGAVGTGTVFLQVEGPGGFTVTRSWDIEVRPIQAPVTRQSVVQLTPGKDLTVDREVVSDFLPGTASVTVAVSALRGFDVASLLRSLDKYPYGCLEQTTSRALPLLYFNDLALIGETRQDNQIPRRVQDAVFSVFDRQMGDGGFGMWGAVGSPADQWLQVYTYDFLMRARDKGYVVPEVAYRKGMAWLQRSAERFAPNAQAYAWYVLARGGLADAGRVRYFQDNDGRKTTGALAGGHLAAALTLIGERGRAATEFAHALSAVGDTPTGDYYGTALRDLAGLMAVAPEANQRPALVRLVGLMAEQKRTEARWTTTQEKAWMLLAASATLQGGGGKLDLKIDGQSVKPERDPAVFDVDLRDGRRKVVANAASTDVWATVSARGVPTAPLPPEQKGLTISRVYTTLSDGAVDLLNVRQNDRLKVTVTVWNESNAYREIALLDLLPAGFEIEGVQKSEERPVSVEARDDRMFAAVNLGAREIPAAQRWWYRDEEKPRKFGQVTYIVRAVTPGAYALPAPQAEDMYDPQTVARGESGRVVIVPR
ncbi:MAG: alpha-2-macroglobulin family protein [Rhodospirillales bacterium]|nr:MAG: alpha-2-macroglobulin family protein [Rhodospirillales bacterium]